MSPASSKPFTQPISVPHSPKPDLYPPSPREPQWVYAFGGGTADGKIGLKSLLGGKGAGLAEMSLLGLPVPPGFTLTTAVCRYFHSNSSTFPPTLEHAVSTALRNLEVRTGQSFGGDDPDGAPLLLSVRSGAAESMPGMMDTVLNLGLNDRTVQTLGERAGDMRFAYDSYRRFVAMFGTVVLGIPGDLFEAALEASKEASGVKQDTELSAGSLKQLVEEFKAIVKRESDSECPTDVHAQLWTSVKAVFNSWHNPRCVTYRKIHGLGDGGGTAVTVQAMVFGNLGAGCMTGVMFSRDPGSGEKVPYGEFLPDAQGEDVVSGVRTPHRLSLLEAKRFQSVLPPLEEYSPGLYKELIAVSRTLERHFGDVQDIEFTAQSHKLYILQTRAAKRSARAAVQIAVDLANEGMITRREALRRVTPHVIRQLLHACLEHPIRAKPLAKGLPASPGAASGAVVLTPEEVDPATPCVLVRKDTSPDDVPGMARARGVLTRTGGLTSHAAVVARGLGVPCVCGAGGVDILEGAVRIGGETIRKGEWITIDGSSGQVYKGKLRTTDAEMTEAAEELLAWSDDVARLHVIANAETPRDVNKARQHGAKGVGLARTEHMFFDAGRIDAMRAMILARDEATREKVLGQLREWQRDDFVTLLEAMHGLPVTVRLLDPPLHEFLPKGPGAHAEYERVAKLLGVEVGPLEKKGREMEEANPMLGLRGVRVGVVVPSVYAMQIEALFDAGERTGHTQMNIMVPFTTSVAEFVFVKDMITRLASARDVSPGVYSVGTMIETPRAALQAGGIAEHAAFFSFGTNDLTQTTFALSRDDAGFLEVYENKGLIERDPFQAIDTEAVGELIEIACKRGKHANQNLHTAVCGEQATDPESVAFCHKAGLDAVSVSPFAVPVARLAAAHAALTE